MWFFLVCPLIAGPSVVQVVDVPEVSVRRLGSECLDQVASRLSASDYRYVQVDQFGKSVDLITVAHEGLHMLDARISRPGWRGFYLGNGVGFRLRIPPARISRVRFPERGRVYRTYVVEAQRWHDKDIGYLGEEALAYLVGAKTRRDLGWEKRGETVTFGRELTGYYRCAVESLREQAPDFDRRGHEGLVEYLERSWRAFQ